jgi:hypothetical protein
MIARKRSAMIRRMCLGLVILMLCLPIFAQKKEVQLPKVFTTAQFIFVETVYGAVNDTALDPRISPEDRDAVYRVEEALRTWGRYQLTLRRSDADLVFAVRKGRLAEAHGGVKVSRGPQTPGGPSQTTSGPLFGGEAGSPFDLLIVYTKNPDGSLGGPNWNHTQDHGLDSPDLPLVRKFKEAVEAASKTQAKKTP